MAKLLPILLLVATAAVGQVTTRNVAIRSGSTLDSDALAWKRNVNAAGSNVSATVLRHVSDFVKGCKSDNIWSKLLDVGVFAGDDLTAALVKLKSLSGTSYTNTGFVAGDYNEARGLTGSGTTKYLRTGFNPNTAIGFDSTHIAAYSSQGSSTSILVLAGSGFDAVSPYYLLWHDNSRIVYSDVGTRAPRPQSPVLTAPGQVMPTGEPLGFFIGTNSTALTEQVLYRNGTAVDTELNAGGTALPTVDPYVFAANKPAVAGTNNTNVMGFISFGTHLTASDATALTQRVYTLMHALQRSRQLVVYEGDSITMGNGTATPYPNRVNTAMGSPPLFTYDAAVASATISGGGTPSNSLTARAPTIDGLYSTALYRNNVLMAAAGHNDLAGADSAATAFAELKAYCLARRATGYKIIVATLLPSTKAGFNTKRNAFNALIYADTSFYDVLCDFAAEPTIGPDAAASDTTYYGDGTHPTNAAHILMTTVAQTAVQAALAL